MFQLITHTIWKRTKKFNVLILILLLNVFGICLAQKNSKDNPQAEIFIQKCRSNLENGNIDMAIYYGKKAIQLNNSNSQYHLCLGRAYGMKAQGSSILKKFSYAKKCRKEWEKAVQLDSKNIDARFDLINYYLQAPGIMGGSKEKAKKQATEILKIDPLMGHYAFARIYEYEKDFIGVEQEYKKAIEINPKDTRPYFNLGYFYQNQKRYGEANDIFHKILKIDPNEMNAYYQLGRTALFSGKNLEEGIDYLKKYLEVKPQPNSPSWASAHWRMGMIYEKLRNGERAISEYKKALELDPKHKQAKEALEKLKS